MIQGLETVRSSVVLAVVALVRIYQRTVSRLLPPTCRFEPSCSEYAILALQHRGIVRGSGLAIGRLLRCHPLHPGGPDPVPGVGAQDNGREDGPKDPPRGRPGRTRIGRLPNRLRASSATRG